MDNSSQVTNRWFNLTAQVDADATLAKSAVLGEVLLVVGGTSDVYLNVQCISCSTLQPVSYFVETNGVLNRHGHCLLKYQDSMYIFGGLHARSGRRLGQIARLEVTRLGLRATVVSHDHRTACTGMTACLFGQNNDQVVLFGGKDGEGKCSNEVLKFMPAHDTAPESRVMSIEIAGDRPSARCNHSATVCGDRQQFLIVVGGQDSSGICMDVWLLDLSKADESNKVEVPVEDPKAKKAPPAKGQPAVPEVSPTACIWAKVNVESEFESTVRRSMHVCIAHESITGNNATLILAAGVNRFGDLLYDVLQLGVDIENRRIVACQAIDASIFEVTDNEDALSSVFVVKNEENGTPVAISLFRGLNSQIHCFLLEGATNHPFGRALQKEVLLLIEQTELRREAEATGEVADVIPTSLNYPDGSSYFGDLVRDDKMSSNSTEFYRHGSGTMNFQDGVCYQGQWRNDLKEGTGILTFPNGAGRYEGSFSHDVISGYGSVAVTYVVGIDEHHPLISSMVSELKLDSPNEFSYTGEFKYGKFNGFGTLQTSNFTYEGSFTEGRFHGRGVLTTLSEKYHGIFDRGVKQDTDAECSYYSSSTQYKGAFRNGKRNGYGTLTELESGQVLYVGKYVGDKKCGNGEIWYIDGSKYRGTFQDDLPFGQGTMYYADGSEYFGAWRNGKRNGKGTVVLPDGSSSFCEFRNDEIILSR